MFQTFRNAWKIPELKNRLLFTLAILVVYRLGCAIPVPFVSGSALTQMFANGDMLSYLNMMSGGALARCTLFALGVTPYINASIIVQLLTVAIPALENLAKEADGQQKLQQITRYVGGVIALVMSLGYYFVIRNMGALKYTSGAGQQTRDGGVDTGPVGNDRGEDQQRDTVADTLVVDLLTTPGDQLRTCGKGGNDDNGGKDTGRAARILQCAHIADHEIVANAHHQTDDAAGVPGDLLQLGLSVGFLCQVLQRGDRNGQQLHNDGGVDIGCHT